MGNTTSTSKRSKKKSSIKDHQTNHANQSPFVEHTTNDTNQSPVVEHTTNDANQSPVVEHTTNDTNQSPVVEHTTNDANQSPVVEHTTNDANQSPVVEHTTNDANQSPVVEHTTKEEPFTPQTIWNPASNEFKLGDSPQNVNSYLPKKFSVPIWAHLPRADEYKQDVVKYFWLKLSEFGDEITKFIPPNVSIKESSYVCFLFFDQKLFRISIRLFHDGQHQNYDEIIEAYAKAVNTPIITTENGKKFYYEDNRIAYFSRFSTDKSHSLIEVIRKDQTTSDDGHQYFRSATHHQSQRKEERSIKDHQTNNANQSPVVEHTTKEEPSTPQTIWNPAFNEFKLRDSPQNVNSYLPKKFSVPIWAHLPRADEYKQDVVKYFWLKLSEFGDEITKFIPPNVSIKESSYVCFLFFDQKLFRISIRLFHDGQHQNYDEIIEAYAKAVNTPIITTENGKKFYYEDNRIAYFSRFSTDKSHSLIEVIRKDQTTSDDGHQYFRSATHHQS
ncbi:unnamed protein product, partial [Didymodactylos carnosus]